jgi:nitrogen fixation protein FixH
MLTGWALTLALLLTPATGGAEEAHGHSHRGGQEVRIGIYEVELTVAGSEMTLHVNDTKDQQVNTEGFTATAVVLAKGNQQKIVELAHAGDNRLVGKLDFATDARFRATVTLRSPKGEVGKGRYNLNVTR